MAIEGIDAYGKCKNCGVVCWTETHPDHQAVVCPCGGLKIDEKQVIGEVDETFGDAEMQAVLDNGG